MTTNPRDPEIFPSAPSTTLDLVRAEIGQMMALAEEVRARIESDRLAHEKAAAELIARTEARAAEIRSEAEAFATDTRRSANEYSLEQRNEIEQLRNSLITTDELLAKAEAEAKTRHDEILSEAEARLSSLVDAQRDARNNLTKVVNGIDLALEQHSNAPHPDQETNS